MKKPHLFFKPGLAAAVILAAVLAVVGGATPRLAAFAGIDATSARDSRPHKFKIRVKVKRPFAPGVSQPLNLKLTNPYRFSLAITRLRVTIRIDARYPSRCRARPNFKVYRMRKRAYPIRLRPRRTRTLRSLRVKRLPRVAMRNLATNQDVCQGVRLKLKYAGNARKWRRGHSGARR